MTDLAPEAQALARDETEQARLLARAERAQAELDRATRVATEARSRQTSEDADVARLESFSPTRVLAALRGSRDDDLARERAEAQAAAYAVARAEADVERARVELNASREGLRVLGDVAARRVELRQRIAEQVRGEGGPQAEQLTALAEQVGVLVAQERELVEAREAARRALQALHDAGELLGSAQSWAAYDTFFNGGLITDAVKYDKLDRAQALMQAADRALADLSRELADVGEAGVGGLGISPTNRIFDMWFDNIFSDWSVRNRIAEAADRVAATGQRVGELHRSLTERLAEVGRQRGEVETRRDALLDGRVGQG